MKYLDEYRNEALAQKVVGEIRRVVTRPWVLMEVCGGQTLNMGSIICFLPKSNWCTDPVAPCVSPH